MRLFILCCFVFGIGAATFGQQQMVLLKRGDVVARFEQGDNIKCKLRNGKTKEGMAIRYTDTFILLRGDTIMFSDIYKIHAKGKRKADFRQKVGTVLLIGGVGYFAIDQINTLFFVKGQSGIDEGVAITSGSLVAAGAALTFLRSPYIKVRGLSIRMITPESRYYRYE
ncbi:MAG: hypothetical protein E6Q96_07750 [Cyclobacteriaceae bacterium]|nr:MAG: hypothetical protein E6Q96_07750 [Cyclobacteriaceae bacterium]